MRLYRLSGQGGDERLRLAEADAPVPGPRDVLVCMRAVSQAHIGKVVIEIGG